MTLQGQGVLRSGLARLHLPDFTNPLQAIVRFVDKTLVIAELEARKLRHDPTELLTRAVQPTLWLLVFGVVFTRVQAILSFRTA